MFLETRFPTYISRGASGGPMRRVPIVTKSNGSEERNSPWKHSRRRYNVGVGLRRADDLATVLAFYEATHGRLYGFRYKDWGDYKSCLPSLDVAATDQLIGTGDGSTVGFQLIKTYATPVSSYARPITKPVDGTVLISLDGIAQGSGWTVDTTTGIVTFATAPPTDVLVKAGFEFDVPVRFENEELDVVLNFDKHWSAPSIPLMEIKG